MDQALFNYFPQGNSFEEQILQEKCSLHPDHCCDLIDLSLQALTPRICFLCAQEYQIPVEKVLTIRQLFGSSSDSFLNTHRVLENMQLSREVQNALASIEEISSQSEKFFATLETTILNSIQKAKSAKKLKIEQLAELYKTALECFKTINQFEELKTQFLLNSNQDSSVFKQCIQAYVLNCTVNTSLIESILQEFNNQKNMFSLQQPEKIKEMTQNMIASVDLFLNIIPSNIQVTAKSDGFLSINEIQQKKGKSCKLELEILTQDLKLLLAQVGQNKQVPPFYEQLQELPVTLNFDEGSYEGTLLNEKVRHGYGNMFFKSGDFYQGEWENDKMSGQGVYYWSNGAIYEGQWKNGKKNGKGKTTWPDTSKYEGDWKDDKKDGEGKYTWPDGSNYEGGWINDNKEGKGISYYSDGSVYKGEWKNGQKEGPGQFFDAQGKMIEKKLLLE